MGSLYLVLGNILLKQYFLSLVGFLFIIVGTISWWEQYKKYKWEQWDGCCCAYGWICSTSFWISWPRFVWRSLSFCFNLATPMVTMFSEKIFHFIKKFRYRPFRDNDSWRGVLSYFHSRFSPIFSPYGGL